MGFHPRPLQLPVAGRREDVVLDEIVASVMLVKASRRRPVDTIAPHHNPRGALVCIEAPAAVVVAGDVVDHVPFHHGAGRHTERVDASHVGEHAMAEVVDVVGGNANVVRAALHVAPDPADRHAGVSEVVDIAVLDRAVGGVADPDAHPRCMDPAPVADRGVANRDPLDSPRHSGRIAPRPGAAAGADQHAAAAKIGEVAPLDGAVRTAAAKLNRVAAHVSHATVHKGNMPQVRRRDRRCHIDIGLWERLAGWWKCPVSVGKGQPLEAHMLDEATAGGISLQPHQLIELRRDHLRRWKRLAWQRAVGEDPFSSVEIPRPRRSDRFAHIFNAVAVARRKLPPAGRRHRPAGEPHGAASGLRFAAGPLLWSDLGNPHARHRPAMHGHHLHVADIAPVGTDIIGGKPKAIMPLPLGSGRGRHRSGNRVPADRGQNRPEPPLPIHK